jgi:hypothetical protein
VNKGSTKRQMHAIGNHERYNQTNQGSAYHVYVAAVYLIPLRLRLLI